MSPVNNNKNKKDSGRVSVAGRVAVGLIALLAIVWFYPHSTDSALKYEQGKPWNYAKLIAPFDVAIYPDSVTVSQAADSLNATFAPIYRNEPFRVDSAIAVIKNRIVAADSMIAGQQSDMEALLGGSRQQDFFKRLDRNLRQAYDRGVVADSLPASYGDLTSANIRIPDLTVKTTRSDKQRPNILKVVPRTSFMTVGQLDNLLSELAKASDMARAYQNAAVTSVLQPNIAFDAAETDRLYKNDYAKLTMIRGVIQQGQTIIDKGAVVTAQDYVNLKTYEAELAKHDGADKRSPWLIWVGQILFVGMLLAAFMGYLVLFEPAIWRSTRSFGFLLAMIVAFFLLGVAADRIATNGIYVVPMVIVPLLTLVFLNGRVAIWTSLILTLLCAGVCTTFALEYIVIQFLGMTAVVYSLRDLTQRSQLLRASLFVAIGYLVSYLAIELMMNGNFDQLQWHMPVMLAINAVLTSLAYVLMFAMERLFGFVSKVTLVELADTNNPLLRRLSDECPGTFQHSLSVSTLAGDAARAIDADTLLVRAGAMYHDIGKMSNPVFFTENQHGVNPHDGLEPQKSAEIIIGHVTEGLRRASAAKLPAVIRDFISQHHGAGTAKYFYITACRNNPDQTVDPAPFTYPGPNPQTREASVLMMADAVEAASRSLQEHTPEAISTLVNRIIDGQIAEGLHNDSPISFRDVSTIKDAFTKRLTTMYHSRIAYPTAPNKRG